MAWPNDNGTVATDMQGTTLVTFDDHALWHRTAGSELNSLYTTFGSTAGTNLFGVYTAGQLPLAEKGGTIQKTITNGTFNNITAGTPSITGGTATNAFWQSGTVSQAIFQLGTAGTLVLDNPMFQHQGTNLGTIQGGIYNAGSFTNGTINTSIIAVFSSVANPAGTTNPVLTAGSAGLLTLIGGGAAGTITIPPAGSLPIGQTITLIAQNSSTVVKRSASDTFLAYGSGQTGGGTTSFTMTQFAVYTFVNYDASANWLYWKY